MPCAVTLGPETGLPNVTMTVFTVCINLEHVFGSSTYLLPSFLPSLPPSLPPHGAIAQGERWPEQYVLTHSWS
jgi:hypothetical protein